MSREASNTDRFSMAAFRQYCGKSLANIYRYSLRDVPCLAKKLLTENCKAPHILDFALKFCADDVALLTQGKEDKQKLK